MSRVGEFEKRSFMYSRAPIPFSSDAIARLAPATVERSCQKQLYITSLIKLALEDTNINVTYFLCGHLTVESCYIEDNTGLQFR